MNYIKILGYYYKNYSTTVERNSLYDNVVSIKLEKSGIRKIVDYDTNLDRPLSNIVDEIFNICITKHDLLLTINDESFANDYNSNRYGYRRWGYMNLEGDYSTIYSLEANGKVRSFVGLINNFIGIVYPIGFDLNKQEFIKFPINELGLIDDNKMRELVFQDDQIGFDLEEYKDVMKDPYFYSRLKKLLKSDYIIYDEVESEKYDMVHNGTGDIIICKLFEYNFETHLEVERIIDEKNNTK